MNHKPTITFNQLSDLANIFSEPENIEGCPNEADFEMEKFRKVFDSTKVRVFNGYMVYSSPYPVTNSKYAERIIKDMGLKLSVTPSMISNTFTVQFTGNGK